MNSFWDKAEKCKHKNVYPDYAVTCCETLFCGGAEYHCKDCGVYFTTCRCGCNVGMSGWPRSRWRKHYE